MRFSGEFERTLDAKNRAAMPPKLKACLDDGQFVLTLMPEENFIRVYRVDEWEALTDEILFVDDGVDNSDMQRDIYHNTEYCELDAQSRFAIPQRFINEIGLERDITLVGIGRRAEIWSTEKYKAHISRKEANRKKVVLRY